MVQKNSQTYNIEIKNVKEVYDYCLLNKILDIDEFINKCFKNGFHTEKYGLLGNSLNEGEKHLKNEVIVEKRVEIPIEVIKEVEKIVEVIKEVPVDRIVEKEIIREVPVEKVVIQEVVKEVPVDRIIEKEIYITDDTQVSELLNKIEELEQEKQKFSTKSTELETQVQEFSIKTVEMENIFQNKMSKKDEELDELRCNLDKPVTDNRLNMLQETLNKLRKELTDKNGKITELEGTIKNLEQINKNQGAVYMKGSNLSQNL